MPITSHHRTITQVAIAQGAAGSTDLVVAQDGQLLIYVVSIVIALDASGTVKFTEGTGPTDLTGALPVTSNGGFVIVGDGIEPVLQTNTAASKLSIVSGTGKAFGYIRYFVA